MPVTETSVINIVCDNPACPGNSLDATDRTGWTFVSTEVYGEPTQSHVYCSSGCAGTVSDVLAADAADDEAGAMASSSSSRSRK